MRLVGQSTLGCRFFPFITLTILCHSFLDWRVSVEKSGRSSLVHCHFSLVAFNILFLSLIFVSLITMHFGVFLLGFILPGILCAFWIWLSIPLPRQEVFIYHLFTCFLGSFISPPSKISITLKHTHTHTHTHTHMYFCFIEYAKAFHCVGHKKMWKILIELEILDHFRRSAS